MTFDSQDSSIPVIDFSPWTRNGDEESKTKVSKQIYDAFTTIGFITILNHGAEDLTKSGFQKSKDFFSLTKDTKMNYKYLSCEANRGYISIGQEKFDGKESDLKETFDIGFEGDEVFENRWPDAEIGEDFKETMIDYFRTYDEIHLNILRALARGMGLHDDYFTTLCNGNHQNLRLLHYPKCEREEIKRGRKRGGIHTDYGTITLLSVEEIGGLVAQDLDGKWIPVPPIEGGITVNVGEMLQRWSNDIFRATPHQVLDDDPCKPFDEKNQYVPERYSIAFFCNANKETSLDCLPKCFGTENPPRYEPVNAHDYITMRLASTIPV